MEVSTLAERIGEEESVDAQQILQLILDNIPLAVFWKDRNSVYLGCNRNFAGDAGQGAPENVVGKTDYDLPWSREQSDFFRMMDRRVVNDRAPIYHIIQYQIQADGKHYWVDTNKMPLLNADGEVVGILGIEEKLRLSREQYQLETDHVQVGTWEYNPDSGAMYFDVGLKAILGLESTRLSHTPDDWLSRVHPVYRAQVSKALREHLQGLSSSYEQKYSVMDAGGRTRWVLARGSTAYDANGRARRISGVVADITSLKQAEDRLRRRDIIQEAISYATQQLLFTRQVEAALPEVLGHLGRAVGFDRAYILQNLPGPDGDPAAAARWLWQNEAVAPNGHAAMETPFPYRLCGRWEAELSGGRAVQGFTRDFPATEAAFCRARGIVSLVWVPIFSEGKWWGVLGFDTLIAEELCLDSEVEALRSAAGILGAVFAQQRIQEAEREQRVLAEALRDTAALLNSTLNLDEVLERMMFTIGRVVPHDAASILLLQDGGVSAVCALSRDRSYSVTSLDQPAPPDDWPFAGRVVAEQRPLVLSGLAEAPAWRDADMRWAQSYLGAPVILEDEVIGVINLFSAEGGFFRVEHADRLRAFVDQAAIAIHNAGLYRQAQEAAILEERQRLARDLHDAISQTLWTAGLIADVLPTVWQHDQVQALKDLEKLRRLTRGALAEMRMLLLELRPSALIEADLDDLLHKLAESIMSRKKVDVIVTVSGGALACPPDVKVGLYRIAQESLNNVVRHARARTVSITLDCRADSLLLTIQDDGRGFDTSDEPAEHLGLTFMAERAHLIGAALTILSRPGAGTTIAVRWPAGDRT